jgi:hypothetical protein
MTRHAVRLPVALAVTLLAPLSFGTAAAGSPAGWVSLSLVEYWGPCPTGQTTPCARSWTVTHRGDSVRIQLEGRESSIALKPADARAVASILASKEFQDGLVSRFECASAPTDFYRVVEAIYQDGSKARRFVTGCSAQSAPGRLHDLLSQY